MAWPCCCAAAPGDEAVEAAEPARVLRGTTWPEERGSDGEPEEVAAAKGSAEATPSASTGPNGLRGLAHHHHHEDEHASSSSPPATGSGAPPPSSRPDARRHGVWSGSYAVEDIVQAGVPLEAAAGVAELARRVGAHGPEPMSDPITLWRFWRARECDAAAAERMYRETCAWRADFSIRDVMAAHGIGEEYDTGGARAAPESVTPWAWRRRVDTAEAAFMQQCGFWGRLQASAPEDGAPIAVWRVGTVDAPGYLREEVLDILRVGIVAHLEDLLQGGRVESLRRGRLVRSRLIIDAAGLSAWSLRYLWVFRSIVEVGKPHFPEVFGSFTVVNAPALLASAFRVLEKSLTPGMRQKLCVLGPDFDEGLRRHTGLERSCLPACLGGLAPDGDLCAAGLVPPGALAQLGKQG